MNDVSQTADSGVFGGESFDVVEDVSNVAGTAEEVAAKTGANEDGAEKQSENGQAADAAKPEEEPAAAEGDKPEGGEGQSTEGDKGEDEAEQADTDGDNSEDKAFRDKYSRERDARLRVQRTFRKDLQRQIDDGATVEDIAEAHDVSVAEIESILNDEELAVLDSSNPIEAKGQEIAQAYGSNKRLADAYAKSTLGEDVPFEEIAYNVSVAAAGDKEFQQELLSARKEDVIALCVDKYADMRKKGTTTSMNPMQDIASLRDENAQLKAEIEKLKAGGNVKQESENSDDNAPSNGASEKAKDDRPRMSGANDLVSGEELAESSVFGNL